MTKHLHPRHCAVANTVGLIDRHNPTAAPILHQWGSGPTVPLSATGDFALNPRVLTFLYMRSFLGDLGNFDRRL